MTPPSDADFDDFYQGNWGPLVSLCRGMTGSRAVAEEIVQEALFTAHRRWERVGQLDRPDLWVRRVATNRCISRWRRHVSEQRAMQRAWNMRPADEAGPELDPDAAAIWDAVRTLPRRQAAAICLFYVDDLSTKEIGAAMGCSASAVQTHLARARRALRDAGLDDRRRDPRAVAQEKP